MILREKTNQKFKGFFENAACRFQSNEFELPFSEIQRETGAASITMKRALEMLMAEGWLEIKPGRNSRYGRFKLLQWTEAPQVTEEIKNRENQENQGSSKSQDEGSRMAESPIPEAAPSQPREHVPDLREMENQLEILKRRFRTQEMINAVLQDRLAEIEDKLSKR